MDLFDEAVLGEAAARTSLELSAGDLACLAP
jgi:hypothetical protein